MNNVRITSLQAYREMFDNGDIARQEFEILKELSCHHRFISRNEIERNTGIRINAVSGRVNGLVKKGLVIEEGVKTVCPISKRNVFKVSIAPKQGELL